MKQLTALILALVMVACLAGCQAHQPASDVSRTEAPAPQETAASGTTAAAEQTPACILPLPDSLDLEALKDGIVAVSLEKEDIYANEAGEIMMDVTVYCYDVYDMVDISRMQEGDTLVIDQKEITVTSIARNENGCVLINGGLENDGYDLHTDDDTVYYACGYNDAKYYYALGTLSLPVSSGFAFRDLSDPSRDAVTMDAEALLQADESFDFYFNAHNTAIRIENGSVIDMTRVFTP